MFQDQELKNVTGGRTENASFMLHNLCSPTNAIPAMKSRKIGCEGNVADITETAKAFQVSI
jgi:hypothetical protein